jgi:hypothetical protein
VVGLCFRCRIASSSPSSEHKKAAELSLGGFIIDDLRQWSVVR